MANVVRLRIEIPEGEVRRLARKPREYVPATVREGDRVYTNVFQPDVIARRIQEVSGQIQAALSETDPAAATALAQKARSLSRRFQKRAESLRRELVPTTTLSLGAAQALPLADWQPQTDLGEANLTQPSDEAGRTLLRVATTSGCTASWRTTVSLSPGKYRAEGCLRTRGVVFPEDDPRAGAGLRISRHRVGQKHAGDRTWTPVSFDFETTTERPEVELVGELRAVPGEVDFDRNSLRVVRK